MMCKAHMQHISLQIFGFAEAIDGLTRQAAIIERYLSSLPRLPTCRDAGILLMSRQLEHG